MRKSSISQQRLGCFTEPLVCGVDEAGRGPLAGPVVAAAVILSSDIDKKDINDSKLLTPNKRKEISDRIINSSSLWGIGVVESETIDKINILQATFLAMKTAVDNLIHNPDLILVDGKFTIPEIDTTQKAIIKGDKSELSIAAASILAKNHRDTLMIDLDKEYSGYGFAKHKGYATKEHLKNIFKLGPCPIHRKSFKPISDFYS